MTVAIRPADPTDAPFLAEMLVAAAFWRPEGPRGSVSQVMNQPQLAHYVAGWPLAGDFGVVAQDAQRPVGAAWVRWLPETDPGYGFIDADTPELSIGVLQAWRGQGVGFLLVEALVAAARERGLRAMSLSVERDNYARRLSERVGFRQVSAAGGSQTMLLRLPSPG